MYQRVAPKASKLTITANSVTIEVEPKAGAATKFDLYDGKNVVQSEVTSPIKVTGLVPNKQYDNYAVAYAGSSAKTALSFKTFDVVPAAPTITAKAGDSSVTVTFKDGTNTGSSLTKRTIYYDDGSSVKSLSAKVGANTINNLSNGKAYTIYATQTNGKGESAHSSSVKVTPIAPVVQMKSFKIDKTNITGKAGDVVKVSVTDVLPANTTDKTINVASEDAAIAKVTDNGDQTYNIELLQADKTTKIHWVAKDGGSAKADATVTIASDEPEEPVEP